MSFLSRLWSGKESPHDRDAQHATKIRDGKFSDLETGSPTPGSRSGWDVGTTFGVEHRRAAQDDAAEEDVPQREFYSDPDSEGKDDSGSEESSEDPSLLLNVLNVTMLADDCIWVCFQDGQSLVFAAAGSAYAYYLKKADQMTEDMIYTEHGGGTYCFSDGVRKEVSLPKTPRGVLHYAAAQGVKYKEFMRNRNIFEMFARRAASGVLFSSSTETSSASDYSGEEEENAAVAVEEFAPELSESERMRLKSVQPAVGSDVESGSTSRRHGRRRTRKDKILAKYAFSLRRDDKLFGKYPIERVREPALDLRRVQYGSFVVTTYEEWFRWTSHMAISVTEAIFLGALRDWYSEGERSRKYTTSFPQYMDEVFPARPDLEPEDNDEPQVGDRVVVAPDMPVPETDDPVPLPFFGRSTGRKRGAGRGGSDIGLEASRMLSNMICNEFDQHYASINLMYQSMQNVCVQARLLVLETNERYEGEPLPKNPRVDVGELSKLETCLEDLSSALRGWADFTLQDPEKQEERPAELI